MNPKLQVHFEQFKSAGLLPSPKGPALAVVKLTQQDDVTNDELAHAIVADPALVARLLKLANACRNQGTRPVLSVKEAIAILGLNAVRGLALGLSLMKHQPLTNCSAFDYQTFWSRNLARATAMQALTATSRLMQSDEAFCLGLLSRIGELGLACLFPAEYARLLSASPVSGKSLLEAERHAFEFDHVDLSVALLADWGFPPNLVELVNLQEQTETEPDEPPTSRQERLLLTLKLATLIASVCMTEPEGRNALMAKLWLLGEKMSMEANDLMALCDGVVRDWSDWCQLLKVPSHEVPPFVDLMNAQTPAVIQEASVNSSKASPQSGFRVLLADGSADSRNLLRQVLLGAGYSCTEAENGRIGLERALAEQPALMVVDWDMPVMNGITLIRKLRETVAGRAIYILMLTEMDQEERLVEAFKAGADDFLVKPPKPGVLLGRLLAGQRVAASNLEMKRGQTNLKRFATEFEKLNVRLQETQAKDVLNQERFAAKQRQDAERMRDFSLSASDWFWETDAAHRFCFFSANFEKVYGLPPEQLLGKSRKAILEVDALNPPSEVAEHLAKLAAHAPFKNFEYQVRTRTNEVNWVSVSGLPHVHASGKFEGYRGTGTIVTERKLAEASLRAAMQAAQTANMAKSRFLATMSHEIRTPMNGILGMAQMLMMPDLPESERTDYARTILTSGRTLLSLLNDILDLSKIEAGKFQLESTVFSPDALLHETCNLFAGAAQMKGLKIDYQWHGAMQQRYRADSHRLRQMLSNLVGNAIKFTPGGAVRMEAKEIARVDSDTAVLEFSVQDSGIGIASDKIDLLFKPFSQTDSSTTREFGGTGLGLSIVRQLAQVMGGDVGLRSELGKGSSFWFKIRAQIDSEERDSRSTKRTMPSPPIAETGAKLLQGHLLVAEDNPINALVIKSLLGRIGVTMTLVVDGQKAVDLITSGNTSPPPDLILMDVHMPLLDGYGATEKIRRWEIDNAQARIPIIALTADAFEEDRRHCLAVGMDDFLPKPVDIESLKSALTKWLPGRESNSRMAAL